MAQVPSFSSFPEFITNSGKNRTERDISHDKSEPSSNHAQRLQTKKSHTRGSHRESRRDSPQFQHRESLPADSSAGLTNKLFYSDKNGDNLNVQYGSLHTGAVPRYRVLCGGKTVLGLHRKFAVYHCKGAGIEVGLRGSRTVDSLSDPRARIRLLRSPTRRIKFSTDPLKFQGQDGFIRLPSVRKDREPENSYRSIEIEISGSEDGSTNSEDEAANSDGGEHVLSAHQEALKSLEQALQRDPSLSNQWLKLLNQTLSAIPLTSKNALQARSEITVSILARAFEKDPTNVKDKLLCVRYLKAGEEIWDRVRLKSEWEIMLSHGNTDLYMEWLEWNIRTADDGVESVVNAAMKAMTLLSPEQDEVGQVRIFWRVATALRDAGYTERAIAMFQAQSELTFHCPSYVINMEFQSKLEKLEEFWDSEAPRLGESGSQGWQAWDTSQCSNKVPEAGQDSSTPSYPRDMDPYRQWAKYESLMDSKRHAPEMSTSDSDPYSIILFNDIKPMLCNIRTELARLKFRKVFLSFLGLHLPGLSLCSEPQRDWDDRWNLRNLTSYPYLDAIFPQDSSCRRLSTDSVAGVVIGRERLYAPPFSPARFWSEGIIDPLALASAEPGKPLKRGIWSHLDISNVDIDFVKRIFTTLRMPEDAEWETLTLAFELACDPKRALKTSKSLLSTNPSSFHLWRAHAQIERLRGRVDDARKVFKTTLSSPDACARTSRKHTGFLWWDWAEMEWLVGDNQQALMVILKSVGLENTATGVGFLRAKHLLHEVAEEEAEWTNRQPWINLGALLDLLVGGQPGSAMDVFDRQIQLSNGAERESLLTSSLLMVYYHGYTLRKPMPPSILSERVHHALGLYPNNTIMLGLFLEAEKGQGVWGRVRGLLGGCNDDNPKNVTRQIADVWMAGWEKNRWFTEVERTRSGLSVAVEHERTRGSPIIWRIFIEFEIRVGDLHRAKKLLFRAIGECPLHKGECAPKLQEWFQIADDKMTGLYLLAFGPLRSVFESRELDGLADTMVERGLRLHQGIEDVLGETEYNVQEREADEEDDEIEHNARELRRLRPY